jgi:predicted RNA-binding Zn ribbon-like protein
MTADHDKQFEFSAGSLCLDFANTWGNRPEPTGDRLAEYDDLVAWAEQAEVLSPGQSDSLRSRSRREPEAARRVFGEAFELRELIYRIFADLAKNRPPAASDVEHLNRSLAAALPRLRLQPGETDRWRWVWAESDPSLDRPLWPVVRSAADLITSSEVARVRECDLDTCAWLFLDTSRNRTRRWCDMATCGNRAKARRYYRRHRSS